MSTTKEQDTPSSTTNLVDEENNEGGGTRPSSSSTKEDTATAAATSVGPTTKTKKKTTTIKKRLLKNSNSKSVLKNYYGGYQRYSPRFIVGYWSIRGLAAPIRMLLSAAQIDHYVILYDVVEQNGGDEVLWDKSSWLNDKEWLQNEYNPLINLPYLVDCAEDNSNTDEGKDHGDNDNAGSGSCSCAVMSQTNAILAYLGRELKMFGSNKQETRTCEELLCEIMDLRNIMVAFAYKTSESTAKEEAEQLIQKATTQHFHKLEQHLMKQYPNASKRYLGRDELSNATAFRMNSVCHLVGQKFTAPDFHLWEMLDQYEGLCEHYNIPSCLGTCTTYTEKIDSIQMMSSISGGSAPSTELELEKKSSIFPYLKEFYVNFILLPANEEYRIRYNLNNNKIVSGDVIKLPYNNPYARFGSDPRTLGKYQRGQDAPWRGRGIVKKTHTAKIGTGIEYWDDEFVKEAERKWRIQHGLS